jgi:hypothetical protein
MTTVVFVGNRHPSSGPHKRCNNHKKPKAQEKSHPDHDCRCIAIVSGELTFRKPKPNTRQRKEDESQPSGMRTNGSPEKSARAVDEIPHFLPSAHHECFLTCFAGLRGNLHRNTSNPSHHPTAGGAPFWSTEVISYRPRRIENPGRGRACSSSSQGRMICAHREDQNIDACVALTPTACAIRTCSTERSIPETWIPTFMNSTGSRHDPVPISTALVNQ